MFPNLHLVARGRAARSSFSSSALRRFPSLPLGAASTSSAVRFCSSAAAADPQQLQARIQQLESQLRLRDSMIRELLCVASSSSSASSAPTDGKSLHNPDGGRYVVSTADDLADAVLAGASHIILDIAEGTLFLPCPVTVQGDRMLLLETMEMSAFAARDPLGDVSSTSTSSSSLFNKSATSLRPRVRIVGTWTLESRARMNAHDIEFSADNSDTQSLFFLSSGASLVCHDCVLSDAREALYLSSSTQAVLTECRIANNIRGVFESYRSNLRLVGCEFVDNTFHAVLLSGVKRNGETAASAGSSNNKFLTRLEQLGKLGNCFSHPVVEEQNSNNGNKKKCCRGDVCFMYNPMLDKYEEVFVKGEKVVLLDAEATTNLVEQSFGEWG